MTFCIYKAVIIQLDVYRWSLDAVKSCHRGDAPNEVFVKFDVPRSDRKARTYFIDDQKTFVEALLEGMTRNKVPEIRIEYRCMKCDCSFSLPRTRRDQKVTCFKCQSNHVIESLWRILYYRFIYTFSSIMWFIYVLCY